MPEPPLYPDSKSGAGDNSGSTPRWVKVFGTITVVVVLLFIILMFTRGPGGRGPGGHSPFRHLGGHAPSEGGHP